MYVSVSFEVPRSVDVVLFQGFLSVRTEGIISFNIAIAVTYCLCQYAAIHP